MANSQFNCTSTYPGILTTSQRACGLKGASSRIDACCGAAAVLVNQNCYQYCAYNGTITDWIQCVIAGNDGYLPTDTFCEAGVNGTVQASFSSDRQSSAAPRTKDTKLSLLFACLLMLTLCFTSGSSASCTAESLEGYTREGNARRLAPKCQCEKESFCTESITVHEQVNRTLNSYNFPVAQPADPQYDEFFKYVADLTGAQFIASTSLQLVFDAVYPGNSSSYYSWVPIWNCTRGYFTGCEYMLPGVANGTDIPIEACSPILYAANSQEEVVSGPDGTFVLIPFDSTGL